MDSKLIFVVVVLGTFSAVIAENMWTPWFNRDDPLETGDWETVSDILSENPATMCANPVGIECRTIAGAEYDSNDNVSCSPIDGLVCKQADNLNGCADYKVRFLCPVPWTIWFDRDNPSGSGDWETVTSLFSENPTTMCEKPTGIECQTTSGLSYRSTGETITCSAKDGLVCKLADNNNACSDYQVRFLCPGL